MTAPSVNVVRALDDHAQGAVDALDTEIKAAIQRLTALYQERAALQALRDIRTSFSEVTT